MKREELIENMLLREYAVDVCGGIIEISTIDKQVLAVVGETDLYRIDTDYPAFDALEDFEKMEVANILMRYAATPLPYREIGEERDIVRHFTVSEKRWKHRVSHYAY